MKTDNLIQAGQAALRQGQIDRAQSLFTNAAALNPKSEQAWLWLGRVVEEPERREYCFRRALALNPRSAEARRMLQPGTTNAAPARKNPRPSRDVKSQPAKLSRAKPRHTRLDRDKKPQPAKTFASSPVRATTTAPLDNLRHTRAHPVVFGSSVAALIAILFLFLLMQWTSVNRFVQSIALAPTALRPARTATPASTLTPIPKALEINSTRASGELFAQAEKYLSDEKPQLVLDLLLPKLGQFSERQDLEEGYFYLGRAEMMQAHYRSAVGYFQKLQNLEPSIEYRFMLAVAYDLDGDLSDALENYTALSEWNGKDAPIYRPLAERRIKEIMQSIGTPTPILH